MILVTGATGMVGHYLLAELVMQDLPVRAFYRSDKKRDYILKRLENLFNIPDKTLNQIDWFKGDLNDVPRLTEAFKGVTKVYHCAGLVSFQVGDRKKLRKINIEGTANMVNLALAHSVEKFCHLSSVAALGSEINQKPITETSPRNNEKWHSYYDISKYGAEMEVWRASQEGLAVVIVNPAIIIGGGNWTSGSGQLFDRVARGFPLRIPKESGFVAVQDVVRAMCQLMESPLKNERYILAAKTVSFAAITDQIAENLQKKPPRYPLKKWMVVILWLFQSIGYLLFRTSKEITRQRIKELFAKTTYDHSKIKRDLDFTFTPISEALQKTAAEYQLEHPA